MQLARVDLGKDVAVGHEDIDPTVVVEIEEPDAPSQILGVRAQSCLKDSVIKCSVAIVMVQIRGLVGVICLDDIEPAVAVVIANPHAHARLRNPIFIEGASNLRANLLEGSILVVVVEAAWHGVACDVNVGPAIIIKIRCAYTESVRAGWNPLLGYEGRSRRPAWNCEAGSLGNVLKRSVAAIVIQNIAPAA